MAECEFFSVTLLRDIAKWEREWNPSIESLAAVSGPVPLNPTDISLAFVWMGSYAYYFVFRLRYSTSTAAGGGGGPDSKEPFSGDGGLR